MNRFDDFGVLVTRPADQANHFSHMIEEQGGKAINFPTIEIAASDLSVQDQAILKDLSQINIAIFISLNAVRFALEAFKKLNLPFPENIIVATVGPSTAAELKKNNIQVDIVPEKTFSSLGLLAMPELEGIEGDNILIFKGEEGSEVLIERLTKRYANVISVECYRRVIPRHDISNAIKILKAGELDAVTVTSVTCVNNLFVMLEKYKELLLDVEFVVASARIEAACETYNVAHITVADNAGDKAMLAALIDLASRPDQAEDEADE